MLEKLRNIFQVPELKRRHSVHAGAVRGVSPGRAHPDAGRERQGAGGRVREPARHAVRALRPVRGRRVLARDDLRARHHAVHLVLDHSSAARRGGAVLREAAQGRRGRPEEAHADHALRHGADLDHPVVRLQRVPGAAWARRRACRWCRTRACCSSLLDHHHADHRHDLRDVAGREDHRARHRQRHLADHLHQHPRRRAEPRPGRHRQLPGRLAVASSRSLFLAALHGRGGRGGDR